MKNSNVRSYQIYVDMDGVLCNFLKGASDLTGLNLRLHKDWQVIRGTAWKKISEQGSAFWENLPWMHDGKELWDYVKPYSPNILSAFPTAEENKMHAINGKENWIARELGYVQNVHLVKGIDKQLFANENSILIDDSYRNIKQWRAKGGIGIHHICSRTSIKLLKEIRGSNGFDVGLKV